MTFTARLFSAQEREIRRRAIFLLTYNREEPSSDKIFTASNGVLHSGATLVTVVIPQQVPSTHINTGFGSVIFGSKGVPPARDGITLSEDVHSVEPVVEVTGGELFRYGFDGTVWRNAMERLRSRYLVGFYALSGSSRSTIHEIKIELSSEAKLRYLSAVVNAPRGYF